MGDEKGMECIDDFWRASFGRDIVLDTISVIINIFTVSTILLEHLTHEISSIGSGTCSRRSIRHAHVD